MADANSATIYESSRADYNPSQAGDGLLRPRQIVFDSAEGGEWQVITVDPTATYQQIIGFGGAFTDAAMLNLWNMAEPTRDQVLAAYYGPTGNNYSLGRVPIGSCDFSEEFYSYCSTPDDFALTSFALHPTYDLQRRIPIMERARDLRSGGPSSTPLRFFASPWTAPPWMKDNTGWVGGKLKVDPTYRTAWALYFSKFLSAYATEGVEFWAVTVQNEPTASIGVTWESMLFEKAEEAGFIMDYLGPRLQHDHPGVAVIMMDDQKNLLPGWAAAVLGGAARKYVTGIGVHWYEGLIGQIHPGEHFSELEATHVQFPELFILGTEACQGFEVFQHGPVFDRERQWERGESYAHDICGDLLHWSGGWMDWNIVLDQQGGPNHAANFCDAPIIRMNDGNIVKQPMYYALGHFSRFIPPNSRRIGMKSEVNSSFEAPMEAVAFRTPSREIVVVVLNRDMFPHKYRIHDPTRRPNGYLHVAIPERAFHTVVYAAT